MSIWNPPPPRPKEDPTTDQWVWPIDRHPLEKNPNFRSPLDIKWRPSK